MMACNCGMVPVERAGVDRGIPKDIRILLVTAQQQWL
jgi:hypothetical protein